MTTTAPRVLLAFDDEQAFAHSLALAAGLEVRLIKRHRFPDGELKITLPVPLPERVVMLRSLHGPEVDTNTRLIELLLAAGGARQHGARAISLVAPYLAYMRQDAVFTAGEAVSQRIVGVFLAGQFDEVITIDPHLHRVKTLTKAVPAGRATALSAAPLIGAYLALHVHRPLLLGPDAESEQWVQVAAQAGQFDWAVCNKERRGDRDVQVTLPAERVRARHVVLVDDMASTGHTLAQAARAALEAGATQVDAAITHALFVGDALQTLRAAGVKNVWSTDTVTHPSNAISVAALMAGALL